MLVGWQQNQVFIIKALVVYKLLIESFIKVEVLASNRYINFLITVECSKGALNKGT